MSRRNSDISKSLKRCYGMGQTQTCKGVTALRLYTVRPNGGIPTRLRPCSEAAQTSTLKAVMAGLPFIMRQLWETPKQSWRYYALGRIRMHEPIAAVVPFIGRQATVTSTQWKHCSWRERTRMCKAVTAKPLCLRQCKARMRHRLSKRFCRAEPIRTLKLRMELLPCIKRQHSQVPMWWNHCCRAVHIRTRGPTKA